MPRRRRASQLRDEAHVMCPYCGETQLLVVDPETSGEFVQDCDVCCHPWRVRIERTEDGDRGVHGSNHGLILTDAHPEFLLLRVQ